MAPSPGTNNASLPTAALARVTGKKEAWTRIGARERGSLMTRCIDGVLGIANAWVAAASEAKGHAPGSVGAGEERLSGPLVTARYLRLLAESLRAGGRPRLGPVTNAPGRRARVRVFPLTMLDRLTYPGLTADVWLSPGAEPTQGRIYHAPEQGGGEVALVLGAGNVSSIPPLDALGQLAIEGRVCIVKMNPVNAYLRPFFETAFAPLIEPGFLAFVDGEGPVGAALCANPAIDTVHLTGSAATHDRIVWGATPDERTRRRALLDPVLTKPVTSELGAVTPVIVVPGRWTPHEIAFQARHVASMITHNASFNCNAAQLLVVAREWPQRAAFVDAVRTALARTPERRAYYPGSRARYERFREQYPAAQSLTPGADGNVPWTLIDDVAPDPAELLLCEEAFCGLLGVVALDSPHGADPAKFMDAAIPFVNQDVAGTLSCALLIDPRTERAIRDHLATRLSDLRYGAIGINVWPGIVFALGATSWGAFPGHRLDDIGSGIGVVHNALMLDHPERSVAHAPFRITPTPPWFADHQNLDALAKKALAFEARPRWWRYPSLAASALRG
ncbi:MAG: NAD-dependent aldehyde dehydrogenase [Planctomycetes bacterium]|nr:NAD-dependent aldehyde dehydrogenase [Planctomycetota bacterium]